VTPSDRPLLTAIEAARIVWPELPTRPGQRRIYRWAIERIIPEGILLRAGRSVLIRRDPFMRWLAGDDTSTR
jgi:hypothetical protein